ncbi:MAG: sugar ABC transporter permease [Clostridia bacterium]|nr:sugar ABC transporter permease [Clostridia bacterium]
MEITKKTKNKRQMSVRKSELIFLATALAFPLLHFIVMWLLVNFNSITLAFKEYVGANEYVFAGFKNFEELFVSFATKREYQQMLTNTLTMYLFCSPVMLCVTMAIAYAVWKKVYCSKFFSTMLFLPSILSSVVFVMIARIMVAYAFPKLFGGTSGEILNPPQGYTTLLFYHCLLAIGTNMIYFMGAMSSVSPEIVESGQLEGVNAWQEFIHIVFPSIFPTLTSLIVVGLSQVFTNQGLLLAYYGVGADMSVRTFGYHIYVTVQQSVNYNNYPSTAAMGMLFTSISLPIVLAAKHLLEKYGPSEE